MSTATLDARGCEAANFLALRMRHQHHDYPVRCTGRSSDALALYGIGQGPRPYVVGTPVTESGGSWRDKECDKDAPLDESDLLACTITYLMAPKWARERMLPVLTEFQNWVWYGINRYGVKVRSGRRDAS